MDQEVGKFLQAALECSVFIAPREPGLTYNEVLEAGKRAGFQPGEIDDALRCVTDRYFGPGTQRLMPKQHSMLIWGVFLPEDPDYRNVPAFDSVYSQLKASAKAVGSASARLERELIVERAVAQGLPRTDVEAAITVSVLSGHLTEEDGLVRFAPGRETHPLPSEQLRQHTNTPGPRRSEARVRAHPIVEDVVGRRTDGRPKHAEPLDAFAEEIDQLGHGPFRSWWVQMVAELRRGDAQSTPVSVSVLGAALVEGVLTFAAVHARKLRLGAFGSNKLDEDPRRWRIEDLLSGAAHGGEKAILDGLARQRAEGLVRVRQRIHAGRMLSEFPGGVPDLRPEEAREAKAVAEMVVRRVLDWLHRHPSSGASPPGSGS